MFDCRTCPLAIRMLAPTNMAALAIGIRRHGYIVGYGDFKKQ